MNITAEPLLTLAELAAVLHVPVSRAAYAIRSRQIAPARVYGRSRLFDSAARARVVQALEEAGDRPNGAGLDHLTDEEREELRHADATAEERRDEEERRRFLELKAARERGEVLTLRNIEETRRCIERTTGRPVDPGDALTAARFMTPFSLEGKVRMFDEQGARDLAGLLDAAREDDSTRKWFKREALIRSRVRTEDEELRVCRGEEPNTAPELQQYDEAKREILDATFAILDRGGPGAVRALRATIASVQKRLKKQSESDEAGPVV